MQSLFGLVKTVITQKNVKTATKMIRAGLRTGSLSTFVVINLQFQAFLLPNKKHNMLSYKHQIQPFTKT